MSGHSMDAHTPTTDEQLDEALEETFPGSDPAPREGTVFPPGDPPPAPKRPPS